MKISIYVKGTNNIPEPDDDSEGWFINENGVVCEYIYQGYVPYSCMIERDDLYFKIEENK